MLALFLGAWVSVKADLMTKVFQQSKNLEQIIDLWNDKVVVWNEVFRGGGTLWISLKRWVTWDNEAPLIVRLTQWLLALTIALSVTMIIFIGVKIIYSVTKWGDLKNTIQDLWWVFAGLLIALWAMWFIYLIQSIVFRTLNIG